MKAAKSHDAIDTWKFSLSIVCAVVGLAAFLLLLH
ncbi:hypothetical protein RAHE111665_10615 [Rariglobus hedericola]